MSQHEIYCEEKVSESKKKIKENVGFNEKRKIFTEWLVFARNR